MYCKLALRSGKRTLTDCLFYAITMVILTSVIYKACLIALLGNVQAGFETAALPLLTGSIMLVLMGAMNEQVWRRRANELAVYLLLGMEKKRLTLLFFIEMLFFGVVCFFIGCLLGGVTAWADLSDFPLLVGKEITLSLFFRGGAEAFFYFIMIQLLSLFGISRKMKKFEIGQMMKEKRRSQSFGRGKCGFPGFVTILSLLLFVLILTGIVFGNDKSSSVLIGLISIPVISFISGFYHWIWELHSKRRILKKSEFYRSTRLFSYSELMTGVRAWAPVNTIFSLCLLFSACSYIMSRVVAGVDFMGMNGIQRQWMGLLQKNISIIFLTVYFSVLALFHAASLNELGERGRVLSYLGETKKRIKAFTLALGLARLLLPALMSFFLVGVSMVFFYYGVSGNEDRAVWEMMKQGSLRFLGQYWVLCGVYFVGSMMTRGKAGTYCGGAERFR